MTVDTVYLVVRFLSYHPLWGYPFLVVFILATFQTKIIRNLPSVKRERRPAACCPWYYQTFYHGFFKALSCLATTRKTRVSFSSLS